MRILTKLLFILTLMMGAALIAPPGRSPDRRAA